MQKSIFSLSINVYKIIILTINAGFVNVAVMGKECKTELGDGFPLVLLLEFGRSRVGSALSSF